MAFIVEDGTGLLNATSYVSVAEADDYFAVDLNFSATWAALLTPAKEAQLEWATRVLDQKVVWNGYKTVSASTLRWPRSCMTDRDGEAVGANTVPVQVKQATLELAKLLLTSDLTTSQDVNYLKALEVDVVKLTWQDRMGQPTLPSLLNDILRGLGAFAGTGPRFVPIMKV